ncbi:hypothetical protein KHHGKMAE_3849 [Methylobacterium persicinum]|nr:hypothetical protein KHHGKMAE_3849 [Methylobacterium persicinum]
MAWLESVSPITFPLPASEPMEAVLPVRMRVPPASTVTADLYGRARLLSASKSLPPEMVTGPVKEFVPLRICWLVPTLARPPLPSISPANV